MNVDFDGAPETCPKCGGQAEVMFLMGRFNVVCGNKMCKCGPLVVEKLSYMDAINEWNALERKNKC